MDDNQQNVQLIESEEDKKKKAGQTQPGSAFGGGGTTSPIGAKVSPGAGAGASAIGGMMGAAAPSTSMQARAAQQAGQAKGTGFTGVGRYLQANVGSRLGQQVAGRVAQTGQQAATRMGEAVGQFQQELGERQQELTEKEAAARSALARISGAAPAPAALPEQQRIALTKPDIAAKGRVISQPIKTLGESPEEAVSAKAPIEVSPSQQEIAAYQALVGGQIKTPEGIRDIEDVRSQAQLAAQLAKGTQTAAGRMGLLREVVGRGPQQYTKAKSALDALILGQAGGQLAAARKGVAGLERKLGVEESLATEKARQFGAEAQRAKEALTGERSALISDILSKGETQQKEYQTQQEAFLNKARQELAAGKLSREVAEAIFGPDVGTQMSTMGFSKQELANLIESGELPTLKTSLTKQQAAQIEALKTLGSEAGIYKSPEEMSQLAGKTIEGATSSGAGFKFDPLSKYSKKQEVFTEQQNLINKLLEEIAPSDLRPDSYAARQRNLIKDVIYGTGDFGRYHGSIRDQSGNLITGDIERPLSLEARDYYTKENFWDWLARSDGWVGRNQARAIEGALRKIKELGLTGEKLEIEPTKSNK